MNTLLTNDGTLTVNPKAGKLNAKFHPENNYISKEQFYDEELTEEIEDKIITEAIDNEDTIPFDDILI